MRLTKFKIGDIVTHIEHGCKYEVTEIVKGVYECKDITPDDSDKVIHQKKGGGYIYYSVY